MNRQKNQLIKCGEIIQKMDQNFPPGIYKISGNGSPFAELTKASLGVTFDWNGGGNFGTLNYNMQNLVMLLLRLVV